MRARRVGAALAVVVVVPAGGAALGSWEMTCFTHHRRTERVAAAAIACGES
jgi:hypothetical protein